MDDLSKKPVPASKPKTVKAPPGARRLKFVQLGYHMCRFELGGLDIRPDKYRFCGLPTDGTPYCEYHRKITSIPSKPLPHRRNRK